MNMIRIRASLTLGQVKFRINLKSLRFIDLNFLLNDKNLFQAKMKSPLMILIKNNTKNMLIKINKYKIGKI